MKNTSVIINILSGLLTFLMIKGIFKLMNNDALFLEEKLAFLGGLNPILRLSLLTVGIILLIFIVFGLAIINQKLIGFILKKIIKAKN